MQQACSQQPSQEARLLQRLLAESFHFFLRISRPNSQAQATLVTYRAFHLFGMQYALHWPKSFVSITAGALQLKKTESLRGKSWKISNRTLQNGKKKTNRESGPHTWHRTTHVYKKFKAINYANNDTYISLECHQCDLKTECGRLCFCS